MRTSLFANCSTFLFAKKRTLLFTVYKRVLPTELAENYQPGQNSIEDASDLQSEKVAEIYQPDLSSRVPSLMDLSNEMAEIYPLLDGKVLNPSDPDRRCIITGLDISMQKPTSRFLNKKGMIHLYDNNREAYHQLLSELPSQWSKEPLEKQFEKIAHHIRDKFFNKRNSTKRAIERLCFQKTLFNNYDLISDEKKAIAFQP